jgi:hypothetical protein
MPTVTDERRETRRSVAKVRTNTAYTEIWRPLLLARASTILLKYNQHKIVVFGLQFAKKSNVVLYFR